MKTKMEICYPHGFVAFSNLLRFLFLFSLGKSPIAGT